MSNIKSFSDLSKNGGSIKRLVRANNKRENLVEKIPLSAPIVVYIETSAVCNLKCNFCPTNSKKYLETLKNTKIMTFEQFKKIVDDLKEFDEKIKIIWLNGLGEPLLNKDFCKMVRYLKESDVCEKITVISNGTFLSKELSDELVETGLDSFRLSLYGLDEDEYKKTCLSDVKFNQLYNNIKYFYEVSRNKIEFQIKATNYFVNDDKSLNKFIDLFYDICDELFVEDIVPLGSDFDVIEYTSKYNKVYDVSRRNASKVCASPLYTMAIDINSIVKPCCVEYLGVLAYGDVSKQSLKEIWYSTELKKIRLAILKSKIQTCNECNVKSADMIENDIDYIIDVINKN